MKDLRNGSYRASMSNCESSSCDLYYHWLAILWMFSLSRVVLNKNEYKCIEKEKKTYHMFRECKDTKVIG